MTSAAHAVTWTDAEGRERTARWSSAGGFPAPKRVVLGDDRLPAAVAHRMASEGTGILWQGDFHNARQLLGAMRRRADRKRRSYAADPATAFHQHRQRQAQRARVLSLLLVPLDPGGVVPLRRAPDVTAACAEAGLDTGASYALPLRDLLGMVGAHEWRRKGVAIPALGGERIHPHYGVFAPTRSEYVDLVAEAPLPQGRAAWDIGTGTGVLAAVLARRGMAPVTATDSSEAALACARENVVRLGFGDRVDVVGADLFPEAGTASLAVCNPPWVPAKPTSQLEHGVYDPGSAMLRGFLGGLRERLAPGGEGWLVLSDLAERLGLRTREQLLHLFETSGVDVLDRWDGRPRHSRASDEDDPLHVARAGETVSLWRLRPQ